MFHANVPSPCLSSLFKESFRFPNTNSNQPATGAEAAEEKNTLADLDLFIQNTNKTLAMNDMFGFNSKTLPRLHSLQLFFPAKREHHSNSDTAVDELDFLYARDMLNSDLPTSRLITSSEEPEVKKRKLSLSGKSKTALGKNESSWKVWTKTEEVFLVGAVFELLFERGSLTASNERSDVWETVKLKYDEAWAMYEQYLTSVQGSRLEECEAANAKLSIRSSKALYRHYKVLKERVAGNSTNAPPPGTDGKFCFKRYYEAWRQIKSRLYSIPEVPYCEDLTAEIL